VNQKQQVVPIGRGRNSAGYLEMVDGLLWLVFEITYMAKKTMRFADNCVRNDVLCLSGVFVTLSRTSETVMPSSWRLLGYIVSLFAWKAREIAF